MSVGSRAAPRVAVDRKANKWLLCRRIETKAAGRAAAILSDWRLNGTKRATIRRSSVPVFDDDLLSISVSTFQAFLTSGLALKSLEQEDWCRRSNLGLLNVASQSERSTINAKWCCSFSFLGRMSATIYAACNGTSVATLPQ